MAISKLSDSTEPMAIWAQSLVMFDEEISPTQNVILSQGRQALSALLLRIDRLYKVLAEPPLIENFYPHPEIPHLLTEICAHQGVASSIMFNGSPRASDESARAYELRIARYRYVREFCDAANVDLSILRSKTLRNKLIHIDSHVEKAMRTPETGWIIDSAIGYRDQFRNPDVKKVGFCRTFVVQEEKILHLGHEIFVPDLYNQTVSVLACVFGVPPKALPTPPTHSLRAKQQQADQTTV